MRNSVSKVGRDLEHSGENVGTTAIEKAPVATEFDVINTARHLVMGQVKMDKS